MARTSTLVTLGCGLIESTYDDATASEAKAPGRVATAETVVLPRAARTSGAAYAAPVAVCAPESV